MSPISEKRATTQQQQMSQQETIIQASAPTTAMLKENGLGGGAHAFTQNALIHGHHIHGHGHHHHHNQQHLQYNSNGHHHHSHHHHHNNNNNHHAKENASGRSVGGGGGKGLEILDFHESWLEEMEVYKGIMHVKKLGSHNHAHKPQGNQIDVVNNHNTSANNKMSHLTSTNSPMLDASSLAASARATGGGVATNNVVTTGNVKRRFTNENKTRVRVATTLAAVEAAVADGIHEGVNGGGGNANLLHLKRPREETPSKTAGSGKTTSITSSSSHNNAKRSGHSSTPQPTAPIPNANTTNHRHNSPVKSVANAGNSAYNNVASASSSPPAPPTSNSPKNNTKIIVNQFHASSLLNGHHLEEKEKILTQNGLTNNTPATAYEASFYAANYLNPDARNNNPLSSSNGNTLRSSLGEPNNYVGVSLAKNGNADQDFDNADEDPSAAIDDVNTYSDSDSDDEYIGEPFYLKEDGSETLQSKNIRHHTTHHAAIKTSNKSDDNTVDNCDYYTPQTILTPSLFPNVPPYLNYSSHSRTGPTMPPQLHKVLKWKLSPVMPRIVKRVVLNSGFRIIKNTMDWMAVWEKHMKSPGFRTIRSHQKYNHMPGSFRIGRKDSMWRSIQQNMKKFGSKEFGFMQRSYVMPVDLEELRLAWPKNASRLTKWIVKPPASARGTGISIVNKWSQFPKDRPLVVQKYIERPLLINDNKFDMRIYVVLTSINPLRIYMYKDGLARFASVKYSSELNSLDERCMHLTNYSINKFSENYSKNEDFNACQGHKWTLQSLWSCLEERGVNTKRLWATLRNLVIKALVSGEAGLNRMYRQNVNFRYNCFELFGFDVLLDENLVPWLLEINISPSLHSELPLDLHVKGPLIQAVLNTALYQVPPKLSEKNQKEILEQLELKGPLCHDKRIFTTCLTADEIRKHNQFTNRSIEYREEYLDTILDHLNPDDVRCLLVTEDELNRCSPLERIFPTPDTHKYLKFVEHPRYYNRLLDAWEHRYGNCRDQGIEILTNYCKDNYHLQVSDATMEKEPTGTLTEIDLLHVKKDDSSTATTDATDVTKSPTPSKTISDMDIADDATATACFQAESSPNDAAVTTNTTNSYAPATKTKDSENQKTSDQLQPTKSPHHPHHPPQQQLQSNQSHSTSNKESASAAHAMTTIKHNKKSKPTDTTDRKHKTDIFASS